MSVSKASSPTATGSHAELREELREELESTRDLYRELASGATQANWHDPSGNPAWTVGQVLGHIILVFQVIPWKKERLRKGKGVPKGPDFILNFLDVHSTRLRTRKFNPENILTEYDAAHTAAVQTLESIQEHEWSLSAKFFGEQQDTAELFRYHAKHVREHEPDIRAGIDR